jgi:RimJ/RimL family protein N-acetyltransferase
VHFAQRDEYYRFAVFQKATGLFIGQLDFTTLARSTWQCANFGYFISNRYWGRGFGREAAAAGLCLGFELLRYHRLEAAINLDNAKSIVLANSIGMRFEGVRRGWWYEDGAWVDHLIFGANPLDIGLREWPPEVRK